MMKRTLLIMTLCCCAVPLYGAIEAKKNRRNRFRPSNKTETVEVKKSRALLFNAPSVVSMPQAFEPPQEKEKKTFVKSKPAVKEPVVVKNKLAERSSYKKPRTHHNDPILDVSAFYTYLNQDGKDLFSQLSSDGQSLALRLSFAYVDKNKAVEDAYYEMERRKKTSNVHNKRMRRPNKVYL